MYTQTEKRKENKSRAVGNAVAQKKKSAKQGFGFVDNHSKEIEQRLFQMTTNNSRQVKKLIDFHEVGNNNPQVNQGTQLQRKSNNSKNIKVCPKFEVMQLLLSRDAFQQQFGQRHNWLGLRSPYLDPHLQQIHNAIGCYHRIPPHIDEQGEEAVNHWKLKALHDAQHAIYAFQNANVANPAHPAMAGLNALQDQIQDDHRTNIADAVSKGYSLWTPDHNTMDDNERTRVKNLWTSVTTGRDTTGRKSKLRVYTKTLKGKHGEKSIELPEFKDDMNAMHARLLETAGGRDLLESMIRGRKYTNVCPAHTDDRKDFGYVGTGLQPAQQGSFRSQQLEHDASAIIDNNGPLLMTHLPAPPGGVPTTTRFRASRGVDPM